MQDQKSESDQKPISRRWAIRRSQHDSVVSGLAAGIAETLDIEPAIVRAAFVAAVPAGGVGILIYLVGWALTLDDPDDEAVTFTRERLAARSPRQQIALAVIFLSLMLFCESIGLWLGDSFVWPVVLISFGFAIIWLRIDPSRRSGWTKRAFSADPIERRGGAVRLMSGGLLVTAGLAIFLSGVDATSLLGPAAVAVGLTVAGFLLIFGPWVWRLVDQLTSERRERIRSEERAEMAAHLHDSVLQTLALIQRSDDLQSVSLLARQQERELRGWLYGPETSNVNQTLRGALELQAARIEETHRVPIDVVTVGDLPMGDSLAGLVAAAGEAMMNAAKHSNAGQISVFCEVEGNRVEAFVTDHGVGFDPAEVPSDRLGIAESITGRMNRVGGRAEIVSEPGEGTEIYLALRTS